MGTRLRVSIVVACAVVGALLAQTAVASAASRGFDIRNQSTRDLKLQSVQKLRKFACNANFHCFPTFYNFDFEGRPGNGDRLIPGAVQRFEVKWFFGYEYGAEATYNIESTNAQLQVTMRVSGITFTNDSTCKILQAPVGSCTAGGLNIAYR